MNEFKKKVKEIEQELDEDDDDEDVVKPERFSYYFV